MQVISNSGYKLSLRAQRSGVFADRLVGAASRREEKQSQDMGLLHYAVASYPTGSPKEYAFDLHVLAKLGCSQPKRIVF